MAGNPKEERQRHSWTEEMQPVFVGNLNEQMMRINSLLGDDERAKERMGRWFIGYYKMAQDLGVIPLEDETQKPAELAERIVDAVDKQRFFENAYGALIAHHAVSTEDARGFLSALGMSDEAFDRMTTDFETRPMDPSDE